MRMVSPDTGAPEIQLATDQEEYLELTAAKYLDPEGRFMLLTRWRPNEADLERLNRGEDLYISLMTFGNPMQPINVQVGSDGWLQAGHVPSLRR